MSRERIFRTARTAAGIEIDTLSSYNDLVGSLDEFTGEGTFARPAHAVLIRWGSIKQGMRRTS
jgi:hypothetical protein